MARIVNVIVLIPNQLARRPLNAMRTTNTTAADTRRLSLYTWFPLKLGRCGEVKEVILTDEWVMEHKGRFSENAHLYPEKVPTNFMGCPIKVGTIGIEPLVIMTENYTQNNGSSVYKITGLSVDILKFVCEKMNLTTIFLEPSLKFDSISIGTEKADLDEGISDVLTGLVPMMPFFVTANYDATISYKHGTLKMLVPCPKAIPGTQNLMTIFSLSVWLTTGLVLLLITAVFWCAGNVPYRSVCNETHTYQSLSNCFHKAWAVFMGVSVPQQPTTSTLRVFFFLYVCFCFVISTVFQAFFVSYLVEPKYEKKIETLDDLMESEVIYGSIGAFSFAQYTLSYPELVKFHDHKGLQEDCSDLRKCVERMITKRDIAIVTDPLVATYVSRELGTVDVDKLICSLDEALISGDLTVLFKKGNPLLDRFDFLMRRYLEAGLLERIWTELQHRASLKGGGSFSEEASDMFFVFSVSHLMPAFMILLVGTVLSSVAFIAELVVNSLCKRIKKNSRVRRVRVLRSYHRPHYRYRLILF